jgi:quinol-cytochrome oxidoreductase complex cytochrome b subunit
MEMMIDPINASLDGFFVLHLLAPDRQKENQAAYEKGSTTNQQCQSKRIHFLPFSRIDPALFAFGARDCRSYFLFFVAFLLLCFNSTNNAV